MPGRSRKRRPTAHDVAAEIVRRATGADGIKSYVVRLSEPPTQGEQFQLLAARLERRPIAIMPHKCSTIEEWLERYGRR